MVSGTGGGGGVKGNRVSGGARVQSGSTNIREVGREPFVGGTSTSSVGGNASICRWEAVWVAPAPQEVLCRCLAD
jgi:hypothetical protein